MRALVLPFLLLSVSCGDDTAAIDAGSDSGSLDAALDGPLVADAPVLDVPTADAFADAGPEVFGAIGGECGRLMAELRAGTPGSGSRPSFFEIRFDFADDPFDDPADRPRLTDDAQEVLRDGNEGGAPW